jgi:choline monooxygenase
MAGTTIESIIGRDAIAALARPVETARGLPGAAYTADDFFALEQKTLFPAVWAGIGFAGDIPAPGDAMPLTLGGRPLVALRDGNGDIRVFHNVCRHRATVVLQAPARGLANLQCPYHAWTYGLDGTLQATPFWDGTKNAAISGVDKVTHGLVPVRSHVFNHVIFVNLDGKAPAPAEYFAPAIRLFAELDMDGLDLAHRETWEFDANWKLVLDNWENYHHVWVHDGIFDKMTDEVDLKTGASYTEMLPDGNVLTLRRATGAPPRAGISSEVLGALPPIPQKAASRPFTGYTTAILPNTTMTTGINTYAPVVYAPLAPGRTRASMAWYFVRPTAGNPDFAAARERILDRWLGPSRQRLDGAGLRNQDFHCLELQQAARGSPVGDVACFSPVWERNVHHFQNWIVERLATRSARGSSR